MIEFMNKTPSEEMINDVCILLVSTGAFLITGFLAVLIKHYLKT